MLDCAKLRTMFPTPRCILLSALFVLSSASASNVPEPGFVQIFDGHSLSGWQGDVENYEVVGGAIRCRAGEGGTLFTQDVYRDFVVKFEFKLPPGGNNGLAIRYPGVGDPAYSGMCELQVLDDTAEQYADLDARQYHGSAYGMVAAKKGALKPVGEWNEQTVTVIGSTLKVELNGQVILDCDLAEVSDYLANKKHPGKNLKTGHFGFAGHKDPVAFRNIRIMKL